MVETSGCADNLTVQKIMKKLTQSSKGLGFFLHRSKVQALYRGFLKICETEEEQKEVRMAFDQKLMSISEAQARLQSLQLARGGSVHEIKKQSDAKIVEWPWQKQR